ncbi:acylphosphatase [Acidiferrimicrobium sp. IK]|uniref:acylphosphatase n=1 Tax=Acidiferrimicrobium sp. IK TaxID=2871700 RepID=UPI0021CB608A|nr:acylphosphatase [Acidiferrimicrobium sp. IK]MCU4183203.1 acylphosphatase [Acidiferrimicrobium sp. IK]
MSGPVAKHVLVSGRVQGVGFRAACARVAGRLGVAGLVRNLPDGRVEVVAAGEPAAVAALIDWCRAGPSWAEVTDVVVGDWPEPVDPASGFGLG